jgi:hypothetical protein
MIKTIYKKEKIDNYYILDQNAIGHGAFGYVIKGFSKKDNRLYAVKIY